VSPSIVDTATGDETLRFRALTGVAASDQDHAACESRGRLRQDDGRKGAPSDGSHHEIVTWKKHKSECAHQT
jgi:hypothetical protein